MKRCCVPPPISSPAGRRSRVLRRPRCRIRRRSTDTLAKKGEAMTRSLTVSWDDPIAAFAAGKALAGIDYMNEMIAGRIAPPPIMRLMGFRLAQVGEGL